jgi:hypothetical protein
MGSQMNHLLPTTIRYRVNGITREVCQGEIPDIFRQLQFDPVTELELPDTKATDDEFTAWLSIYRHSSPFMMHILLEEAQCD